MFVSMKKLFKFLLFLYAWSTKKLLYMFAVKNELFKFTMEREKLLLIQKNTHWIIICNWLQKLFISDLDQFNLPKSIINDHVKKIKKRGTCTSST